MADILEGYDPEGYEDYNEIYGARIKNNWRHANPLNQFPGLQPGMIVSRGQGDRLYHIVPTSPGHEEILQEFNSSAAKPVFAGIVLGPYSGAVSDPPADAELDAIFTSPAAMGNNVAAFVKDTNSGNQVWMIFSDGVNYWYFKGTVAV